MIKDLVLAVFRKAGAAWLRLNGCHVAGSALVHGYVHVRRKGTGRIIIGDGVVLNSARWSNPLNQSGAMTLCVEDGATLELKRGCGVSSSQLVANLSIELGEEALIGAGCLLCDSNMHEVPLGSGKPIVMAPIRIGARAFIGARCIILKGVTIGEGAVVGAGSVVTSEVPAHTLAAGNPAKILRDLAGD
jgi:carbonic anhydrase/acetyltransferase-like protein (isoleucine patch superfamily)